MRKINKTVDILKNNLMEVENEVAKKGRGRPKKTKELRKRSRTVMASDVEWVMVAEEASVEGKDVSAFVMEEVMRVVKIKRRGRLRSNNGL